MAFIHSTILLAVLLVGPAAAASPLEPVDVGQIVSELGAYFGELASNALSVESAQNEYTRLTQGQTQFSIDKLVSLVVYSAKIQTPPSCYEFISATAENIDYLVKYVTDVEDLKGPAVLSTVLGNATAAFNEADLIMSGQTGTVVVLSGASADFASSVATVTGNPHIQFKFILPQNATPPLPPELSQQNAQSYVLSVNAFAPIASLVEQRNTSASQLEWTTSLDPSTGEKSISFVRPLSTGGTLHGVFHARITVYDLFRAAFRYLDTKPLSYFFVTDSSAERHAIYHPLSQGNTIIQSIFEVERSLRTLVNNTNVITDVSVSSTNVLPLGPSDEEGIQVDTHDYTYSCRVALSINGFSNQLVLCVALRSGANVEVTLRAPAESFDNLAYHTQLPQESACSHLGHQANTDSALRLYGASQPAAGVSDSALHTYLTTGGAVPEDVMQDVRADSNTASVLTRSWATDTLAATWRYFLSDRGLFTVYPGVQLPADYQPAEATWYRSALPHTNVALSPVERDPLGSGFVYGISRRVIASSVPHGVVGAHVSAGSLAAEVKRLAPECEMNENRHDLPAPTEALLSTFTKHNTWNAKYGRLLQPPPDPTDTQPPPAPTSVAAIVVPVVLIVVLIVLILVALMLWYNCRIKGKEEAGTRKHRGAFDFSKDKSLGEEKEAKIAEVTVDSKLDKDKGNLAVAAPVELADSAENGEKPAITDTAI